MPCTQLSEIRLYNNFPWEYAPQNKTGTEVDLKKARVYCPDGGDTNLLIRQLYNCEDEKERWSVNTETPSLYFYFQLPTKVTAFTFNWGPDRPQCDPIAWVFEGSNNGEDWTQLNECGDYTWRGEGERGKSCTDSHRCS